MKISFIGTGVFSLAVAINLAQNKENEICMWSENEELVDAFMKSHKLTKIMPKKEIPENINVSNNYKEVLNNSDIVFVIPSIKYLNDVCQNIKDIIPKNIPVIIGTKGIDEKKEKFAIEIASVILNNPCYLMSGATYATDVANLDLIGYTIGYKSKKGLKTVLNTLNFDNIILDLQKDYLGISICSVLKNIYAIGAGILNGLGYKNSTNALYLNKVYQELGIVLKKCKSSISILNGFAGLSDLIFTCSSLESRNFNFGKILGENRNKKDIEKYIKENTIEGYSSLEAMNKFLKKKNISTPIFDSIYGIVIQKKTPKILKTAIKNN